MAGKPGMRPNPEIAKLDKIIVSMYAAYHVNEIAKRIGKSKAFIYRRAHIMKLKRWEMRQNYKKDMPVDLKPNQHLVPTGIVEKKGNRTIHTMY